MVVLSYYIVSLGPPPSTQRKSISQGCVSVNLYIRKAFTRQHVFSYNSVVVKKYKIYCGYSIDNKLKTNF